jgi:serine/threonine protein kinase
VIAKRKGKPLPPKLAGRWALDAAQGLRYLHEHKPLPVVHRDFKPHKLLIDGSGHCKIADFGLAKVVKIIASRTSALAMGGVASAAGAPGTPVSSSAGSSTPVSAGREGSGGGGSGSGSGVNPARTMPLSPDSPTAASAAEGDNTGESGSYRYMAPEVFRHERYTEKVDIFSFGMIMFQLFSPDSHAPFHSLPSLQAAEAMALRNERPELSPKLPRELAALIEQCWAPDPTKRPTALQCCTVLEALFPDDGKSVPLRPLLEVGGGCTVV